MKYKKDCFNQKEKNIFIFMNNLFFLLSQV